MFSGQTIRTTYIGAYTYIQIYIAPKIVRTNLRRYFVISETLRRSFSGSDRAICLSGRQLSNEIWHLTRYLVCGVVSYVYSLGIISRLQGEFAGKMVIHFTKRDEGTIGWKARPMFTVVCLHLHPSWQVVLMAQPWTRVVSLVCPLTLITQGTDRLTNENRNAKSPTPIKDTFKAV